MHEIRLNGVLDNHFSDSSENARMKCNYCTHKANCPQTGVCKPKEVVSKKKIAKSPDILIVQVNRYLDVAGTKLKTIVWPDDKIHLPSGEEYTICGIGHHLGEHFSGGHYLASIKVNQEWVTCNDTEISNSSESNSKSMECNICI